MLFLFIFFIVIGILGSIWVNKKNDTHTVVPEKTIINSPKKTKKNNVSNYTINKDLLDADILSILKVEGISNAIKATIISRNLDPIQAEIYIKRLKKRKSTITDQKVENTLLEKFKEAGCIDITSLWKLNRAKTDGKTYAYIFTTDYEVMSIKYESYLRNKTNIDIAPK